MNKARLLACAWNDEGNADVSQNSETVLNYVLFLPFHSHRALLLVLLPLPPWYNNGTQRDSQFPILLLVVDR
jgi:hypothetical protein